MFAVHFSYSFVGSTMKFIIMYSIITTFYIFPVIFQINS